MQIRLKEPIHPELKSLGLKAGDVINGQLINEETGLLHFSNYHRNFPVTCSIWKEDYEIVTPQTQTIEAAYQVGFEPTEDAIYSNELLFTEAQEYLTNEALRA